MIEKIVQTAKQVVKAIVLSVRARDWSAREAVTVVGMAETPARMAHSPRLGLSHSWGRRGPDLVDLDHPMQILAVK
jgi:hypothetical protein